MNKNSQFEEFKQFVKQNFNLNIEKDLSSTPLTFEDIFGMSFIKVEED